jgi:flagellin-like protein
MYKREEAVSPVIGVILMVAITVILAAVIAAFVFGMAGNVQKTKNVAFTVERASTTNTGIVITNQGGKDSGDVTSVAVLIDGTAALASTASLTTIGQSVQTGDAKSGAKSKVTITATFKDGSKQVVVDTLV